MIQSKAPDSLASEFTSVISELEKIRGIDIRTASRALSPDIRSVGLAQCLLELSSTYSDTMAVTFEFSDLSDEVEALSGLAVYRICEQGLLNALTHGAAKNCAVRLRVEDNRVHVVIDNDGAKLQGASRSASGSAIIDAWVSSFSGTWSLRDLGASEVNSKYKVRLEAKLKLDTSPISARV
jgi:signal transduction histidine kinase